MQLENSFTIAAPIDKAWEALNTPEIVAPCFPGATLQSYEGASFTGTVKVKLGPISLTYKGKGTYVTRDEANRKVVIEASGRDARGNGTANATVTGTLTADGPDKTTVKMVTDLTITGRPAQFGRGVISDVADKIIGQFAGCLAEKLAPQPSAAVTEQKPSASAAEGESAAATTAGTGAASESARTNGSASSSTGTAATSTTSGPVKSQVDAIDLLDTAGAPVLKRLGPALAGALVLLVILLIRRARRR